MFQEKDRYTELAFNATVPGSTLNDLVNAGMTCPDIFWRDNAETVQKYEKTASVGRKEAVLGGTFLQNVRVLRTGRRFSDKKIHVLQQRGQEIKLPALAAYSVIRHRERISSEETVGEENFPIFLPQR